MPPDDLDHVQTREEKNVHGTGDVDTIKDELLIMFEYKRDVDSSVRFIANHFRDVAYSLRHVLPNNRERSAMLRKLLEARDCAVRSHVYGGELWSRED